MDSNDDMCELLRKLIPMNPSVSLHHVRVGLLSLIGQHRITIDHIEGELQHAVECGCTGCRRGAPSMIRLLSAYTQDEAALKAALTILDDFCANYKPPTTEMANEYVDAIKERIREDEAEEELKEQVEKLNSIFEKSAEHTTGEPE